MTRLRTFNLMLLLLGLVAIGLWIDYRWVRWCGAKDETVTLSPVDPCKPFLVVQDVTPYPQYNDLLVSCDRWEVRMKADWERNKLIIHDPCGVCEIEPAIVIELTDESDVVFLDEADE